MADISHEIHVWLIEIDQVPIDHWRHVLDPDERSKADRFRFPADRSRYLAAHMALRQILGRYLNLAPDQIQFRFNEFGKPFVADQSIEFSLSHSDDVILIAITRDHLIGVDVELIRSDFDYHPSVDRYFSADDKSALFNLPPNLQTRKFFELWTRQEAVLKMLGVGLSGLEDHIKVKDARTLQSLDVGADYAAAVAVEDKIDRIQLRRFEEL